MARRTAVAAVLVAVLLLLALSCAAKAPSYRAPSSDAEPGYATPPAPAATAAPAFEQPASSEGSSPGPAGDATGNTAASLTSVERMVIKTAELELVVQSVDGALDQVLGVATDVSGYVLSIVTWEENNNKLGKVTLRVPADRYEEALRRIRGIGRAVKEGSSGEDITQEYVDLQSQLRNLEATAERLRSFLDKTSTVTEALQVNEALKQNEAEIEQIKGRLNYLGDRAAYSTITVYVRPEAIVPTATPTPTPTPVPTPDTWNPLNTAGQAAGALADIVKVLVDVSIWLLIVAGPFVVPVGLLLWLLLRRKKK